MNVDYSQRVMARRKELLPKIMKAREDGKIAYLTFDKLVVGERHDVVNRDLITKYMCNILPSLFI